MTEAGNAHGLAAISHLLVHKSLFFFISILTAQDGAHQLFSLIFYQKRFEDDSSQRFFMFSAKIFIEPDNKNA